MPPASARSSIARHPIGYKAKGGAEAPRLFARAVSCVCSDIVLTFADAGAILAPRRDEHGEFERSQRPQDGDVPDAHRPGGQAPGGSAVSQLRAVAHRRDQYLYPTVHERGRAALHRLAGQPGSAAGAGCGAAGAGGAKGRDSVRREEDWVSEEAMRAHFGLEDAEK